MKARSTPAFPLISSGSMLDALFAQFDVFILAKSAGKNKQKVAERVLIDSLCGRMGPNPLKRHHPLTLPNVRPETSQRLRNKKSSTTGRLTTTAPAEYNPHATSILDWNIFSPSGSVNMVLS